MYHGHDDSIFNVPHSQQKASFLFVSSNLTNACLLSEQSNQFEIQSGNILIFHFWKKCNWDCLWSSKNLAIIVYWLIKVQILCTHHVKCWSHSLQVHMLSFCTQTCHSFLSEKNFWIIMFQQFKIWGYVNLSIFYFWQWFPFLLIPLQQWNYFLKRIITYFPISSSKVANWTSYRNWLWLSTSPEYNKWIEVVDG